MDTNTWILWHNETKVWFWDHEPTEDQVDDIIGCVLAGPGQYAVTNFYLVKVVASYAYRRTGADSDELASHKRDGWPTWQG